MNKLESIRKICDNFVRDTEADANDYIDAIIDILQDDELKE
jgi:hypothetical protein